MTDPKIIEAERTGGCYELRERTEEEENERINKRDDELRDKGLGI